MITLIRHQYDNWTVISKSYGINTSGTYNEIKEILFACGVAPDEVLLAVEQLIENDHSIAEFGVNKMFCFSKHKDIIEEKEIA